LEEYAAIAFRLSGCFGHIGAPEFDMEEMIGESFLADYIAGAWDNKHFAAFGFPTRFAAI
jgi:hypothetical protein